VLTAVVLRGIKESENLPLYSVSRQELQQSAGRPLPFPATTQTAKPTGMPASAVKPTTTPQPPPGITMTKVAVAKANIVNVGRAAAAASQSKLAASSSVTITPVGPSQAPPAAAETTSSKRKRNYVPKRAAQVPLVEVGGPKLPKMPRIPKITDKDIRLPSPASLGLPAMPFAPGLLPG
jgi:hypothetical protein